MKAYKFSRRTPAVEFSVKWLKVELFVFNGEKVC